MLSNITGWHLLIVLAIVLLLFGAPKLPALARSVGQSMKILRSEVREEDEPDPSGAPSPAPAAGVVESTSRPGDPATPAPLT